MEMFKEKIIIFLIISVSCIEFSTQQSGPKTNNETKINESDAREKEIALAAVRRGDIPGLRRGMNRGALKSYGRIFENYSYQIMQEIEDTMNEKMHAVERLIASKLAVPAGKEQPSRHRFNVTILPGTDIISELSLNLEALKKWHYYEKPLHTLCSLPDVEPSIVEVLLEKGLNINEISNISNETPLGLAAFTGNLPLVKFLVEKGADPNRTFSYDAEGYDFRKYHEFIKVFSIKDLVIRNGTKIHQNDLISAIYGGHIEVVKYLISVGADVNVDNQSSSALFLPVGKGRTDLVEILLQNGCDVNGKDVMGMSALHLAADRGDVEIAKLLLKYGANVTSIDNFGWTPLHVAAFSSHNIELVELLLQAGASTDATTDRGFTPLILAEAGSDPSFLGCLGLASARKFSKGISCHLKSKTCTHKDNIYITSLLCNRGAKVNHRDDIIGWTVLHWAGGIGDENAVRVLVEKCKADADSRSKAGMTPLHVAKYFGRSIQFV